jgi:hypothetical protein
MFFWGAAEICERVEYLAEKESRLWEFIMSPTGSVWLVVIGLISLIGVILWPNVQKYFDWVKGILGPSTHDRLKATNKEIECLKKKWIEEAGARSELAISSRQWTDIVNGKVMDLTEKVDILIADYRKRQAKSTI